ncbi:PQQ-dependent sugar dehydrogenase [Marinobacter panjinensis]|uniref:PQQ-dependent sugar dehydrogenase n=1 Tax=Marinobacter panjinensis TaxID=2576384 RepID=A0A4V6CTR9_9GAMM|nr:PQQ-dependent sugar dehydrogenase [Marinobacter panjinensis]MCR8915430.1 PQQ-dependent sugar dehydrogenase [Marinobacter panjinensis]TKV66685.1 PQQ-dependent sugar dehydrogenase [Marinobacter panjinensis]
MAVPGSWWKVVLAFVIALVVGAVLGSLVQTHFNLQALEALGVEIPPGTRLETSAQDLVNFAPLYAVLFGFSFLCSQGVAALVIRLSSNLSRLWLYPLAAAVGLWVTLKIVDALAPMPTLIAATRGTGGLLAMLVTAAISGWLFVVLVNRPARRRRGYSAVPVMTLMLAGSLALPESDAVADEQPAYEIETVAQGLEHPWSLAFLPDGRMLVTERPGRLRLITAEGELLPESLEGVPEVFASAQAGLFEVLPARDFEQSRRIYLSYACGTIEANHTCLARGELGEQGLDNVREIFRVQPAKEGNAHYGGRLAWLPDNTLVLTLGDGFDYREDAQRRENHLGSIVRLNPDGTVPEDNPYAGSDAFEGEIYSYGHRNVQGLVYDQEQDRLIAHEHGPRGGDEINVIRPGANYGWPITTHGLDYTGARVTPFKEREGIEPPLLHWTPSIAPSGMALYRGNLFPRWQGDLLVGGLVTRQVHRVSLENGQAKEVGTLFGELDERIRDVRTGPDGAIYLLTDSADGRVLRVTPE